MPRTRRRDSPEPPQDQRADIYRDDAQPVRVPNGLAYGERTKLEEAQAAVPLPEAPTSSSPTPALRDPMAAALAAAPPGPPLNRPSQRITEPVQAGLTQGPGPGPEVLHGRRRLSDRFAAVAEDLDDPVYAGLAEQARRMGY